MCLIDKLDTNVLLVQSSLAKEEPERVEPWKEYFGYNLAHALLSKP
jgi:hypothetical protein